MRRAREHQGLLRGASSAALVAGLVLLGRALPVERAAREVGALVEGLGPWGLVVYGALYVVAALLLVPGSAITLLGGALFGPLVGVAVVSLASTTAAALAFVLGRTIARPRVERLARRHPRFDAVDRAVADGGWRVVALLRLSPVVPFSLSNYLFGLTGVGFVPYVLASWAAMLPGTAVYVYLGHVGRVGLSGEARSPLEWALLGLGAAATLLVTWLLARRARRALTERRDLGALEQGDAGPPPSLARTAALAAVGLLVLGLGVAAALGALEGRFGPPRVTPREAYAPGPGRATFDHGAFDALLERHVDEAGLVDYEGLARDAAALDAYLAALATAPFDDLSRDDKLALLIDAYNAFTLRLILDHWPVGSIKDIPADRRWDGRRFMLAGRALTLNELEHREVRARFAEPRVHFALNCASIGCPPLRRQAYVGARLEAQLAAQARRVHEDPRWFRHEPGLAHLTRLYDWYADDFVQAAGSVLRFAARYSPPLEADLDAGRPVTVRWLEYDWRINARIGARIDARIDARISAPAQPAR